MASRSKGGSATEDPSGPNAALPGPLLNAADIARWLKVQPSTVYGWARENYIPSVQIGIGKTRPCVRFVEEDVKEWLDAKAQAGRIERVP